MKKIRISVGALMATIVFSSALYAQKPLMTIDGKPVYTEEFEYIYNKNNSNNSIDKKTKKEYMELFKNFKLKVAEAESLGIDTTRSFIQELAGYRKQLTQPYLTDKEMEEQLAKEAYERLKENIEVSHILIRTEEGKEAVAYEKAKTIYDRLKKGEDFGVIAKKESQDPGTAQNGGYLGYITGFLTVYSFEDAAYNTPVGSISEPVKTVFGYHILKIHNRRPDPGQILAAHIMKMVPQDAPDSLVVKAQSEINGIYQQLLSGEDFATLAKEKSDDKNSGQNGGNLPWFGTGRMVKEFEDVAFSLKNKGDISSVIRSPYGFHIIKLIDTKTIESFEEKLTEINRKMTRDERSSKGQASLVEKLKKQYNFTLNQATFDELVALTGNRIDSTFSTKTQKAADRVLYTINGINRLAKDFILFVSMVNPVQTESVQNILKAQLDKFVFEGVLAYEDTKLEEKYVDFRNLIKEYRDGILLFEVSNRQVWDKASKDTEGLAQYFAQNKSSYKWESPKFKGFLIQAKNKEKLKAAQSLIKKVPQDSILYLVRKSLNDSVTYVKIEKGLYAKADNKAIDKYGFKDKKSTFEPAKDFSFVAVSGKVLKSPQEYTDVRGLVTADYQNYLEEQWLKHLNEKYRIVVNEEVLETIPEN